jgi:excisionase family DNA binding protein
VGLRAEPATPALALTVEQAAAAMSVSYDTWREHIEPEVRLVRIGRRKLVPVSELQAWLDRRAERVLADTTTVKSPTKGPTT